MTTAHAIWGRRVGAAVTGSKAASATPPKPPKPPAPPTRVVVVSGVRLDDLPPVNVGTDRDRILTADPNRKEVRIANLGTDTVYIGGPNVGKDSATAVPAGYTYTEQSAAGAELFAVAETGKQRVALQVVY